MWLSSQHHRRTAGLALAVIATLALSGCGFTPLYGTDGAKAKYPLSYADPASQAEQIIYQELALSLGRTTSTIAPRATISTTNTTRRVGRSATGLPTTTQELTLTASAKVTEPDPLNPDVVKTIYTGTKSASATYTTNGQHLADQEAVKEAEKRAAKAVAQSLRLSIKAALNNRY